MIQIYTGDGKGKTTAALGLALRAIGAQKKVAIIQFMKKPDYSEHKALNKYKLPIDIFCFGIGYYKILDDKHTKSEHQKACVDGLNKSIELIKSNKYDLIILDEICVAQGFKLINVDDIINVISPYQKRKNIDIILTGRRVSIKLKKIADLITIMKCEKHYFNLGVKARKGIEF